MPTFAVPDSNNVENEVSSEAGLCFLLASNYAVFAMTSIYHRRRSKEVIESKLFVAKSYTDPDCEDRERQEVE